MKYGVDMEFPPLPKVAQQIAQLGWSFCGVYVGGPRASARHTWHIVDGSRYPVGDISGAFNEFIPIYVGRNVGDDPSSPWDSLDMFTYLQGQIDGDEANNNTGSCGFDSDSPLFLDAEYGTYLAHPSATLAYFNGWSDKVAEAGHTPCIYTDPGTIEGLGDDNPFSITWVAQWMRSARGMQKAPFGRFDPQLPPPWDVWQFGGSVIAGTSVDLSSCRGDITLAKYAL